jgi:hypothetical protein
MSLAVSAQSQSLRVNSVAFDATCNEPAYIKSSPVAKTTLSLVPHRTPAVPSKGEQSCCWQHAQPYVRAGLPWYKQACMLRSWHPAVRSSMGQYMPSTSNASTAG